MAGFLATRTMGQGDYTGKLETFHVAGAHARIIAPGDVVLLSGGSNNGRAGADNFAANIISTQITGIVASIEPQFVGENLSTTALPATTEGFINCHIDPDLTFIVESDTTLPNSAVGLNVAFNAVDAAVNGGLVTSQYTLNAASVLADVGLPFRIMGLLKGVGDTGAMGDRALVQMNNSTLDAGTVGV